MTQPGGQGKSLLAEGNSMWKPRGRTVHLKCKKPGQKSRGTDGIKMRLTNWLRAQSPGVVGPDYYPTYNRKPLIGIQNCIYQEFTDEGKKPGYFYFARNNVSQL